MKPCIALLRGVNVGGKGTLPMKSLTTLLEGLGLSEVKTYIQSGNAVFLTQERSPEKLAAPITAAIQAAHGFAPHVLVLERAPFAEALAANPYPEAEAKPTSLHLLFLDAKPPRPDLETLERLRAETEAFALKGTVFYLHAPDGIGRSKLAARMEKALGVPATARNWRTACQILELANQLKD